MKKLMCVLILVLIASPFLTADMYVKNQKRTLAFQMMGKQIPEKLEIEEQWFAKDKVAIITQDLNFIADLNREQLYVVIPKLKQYFQFPTAIDKKKLREMIPPHIADIITSIKITGVKVNLDTGSKKIANWNCTANELEMVFMIPSLNIMPKLKIKMWVTKDVPFDVKGYTSGIEQVFKQLAMGIFTVDEGTEKEMEKLEKLDGMQVAAEISVGIFGSEIKANTQCLEIMEKKAPKDIYSVPKDYVKKALPLPQPGKKASCETAKKTS